MADLSLTAPLQGWVLPLDEVGDPVFAGRMLGDGLAIDPTGQCLHAPCDATVIGLHASHHAITLRSAEGAEILMHIGLDTVALSGKGFTPHVTLGQRVARGDPLIGFDLDALLLAAPAVATPIIVTNPDRFAIVHRDQDRMIGIGETLMTIVATAPADEESSGPVAGETRRSLRIPLVHGIHARPAARITACIRDVEAEVAMIKDGRRANARSAIALLGLGVRHDDVVELAASGRDADAALTAIAALIEGGMGEAGLAAIPAAAVVGTALGEGVLPGVTAAPGIAIGRAVQFRLPEIEVAADADDPASERARLDSALSAVRCRLASAAATGGPAQRTIMAAHLAFLDDPELHDAAIAEIAAGRSAGHGWRRAIAGQVTVLRGAGDARMAERADDLIDLERQVLRALAGDAADAAIVFPAGTILLADDLLPSQLIALDVANLAGLCVERGGPTSHVAILAAGMGLPALVAMGPALRGIADATPLILDADAGRLHVAPDADRRAATEAAVARASDRAASAHAAAQEEARTRDGTRIEVFANLGSVAGAVQGIANGAEGCGLLRTEFLFLDRDTAPTEAEQTAAYQAIADALHGRPLIVRLLDIGGDKPAAYLPIAPEENPALGLRGIRVGLAHPAMLEAQLRAILAVRPIGQCRIMIPMIASLDELLAVRAALDSATAALGIVEPVELGVMVETPAAAMTADLIAAEADFLSIGTNDLTQYALAMDRGNPAVAAGVDGLHPAVLRLIARTCEGAASHGRWAGVCGGLASDPLAVPILIGLGITELSAVPARVAEIKALVRALDVDACRAHAIAALAQPSATAVRRLASTFRQALLR